MTKGAESPRNGAAWALSFSSRFMPAQAMADDFDAVHRQMLGDDSCLRTARSRRRHYFISP